MRQLDELLDEILHVEEEQNGHVEAEPEREPAELNGHAEAEAAEESQAEAESFEWNGHTEEISTDAEAEAAEAQEDIGSEGGPPGLGITESWYPGAQTVAPAFDDEDESRIAEAEDEAEEGWLSHGPSESEIITDASQAETYAEPYAEEPAETFAERYPTDQYPADQYPVETPAGEYLHTEQPTVPAHPSVEEGQSMEEAMADSWDGSFDVSDEGWDAGAAATETEPWPLETGPDTAPEADSWVPRSGAPLAYEWSPVEAAAAPAAPDLQETPEAPPESDLEIVPDSFSDAFAAESVAEPKAPSEPSAWIDVPVSTPDPGPGPAVAPAEVPAPTRVRALARAGRRGSRQERLARRRPLRVAGVAGLVLAVAAAGLWTITVLHGGPAPRPAPPAAPSLEQQVVAWSVWDENPRGPAFVSVMAVGGGLDPVFLAIPQKTVVSVPGRGLEAMGDTASVGDPEVVAAAVENILGVKVDDATGMPLASLAPLVDRIGGIDVEDPEVFSVQESRLNGPQTVEYLRARPAGTGEAGDDTRFIRWLEVSTAILTKAHEQPGVLEEIPEELRAVFAAAGGGRTEVLDLPVKAIGAGLARPDGEDVARLAREYFVPTAETDQVVRIVVMNGNGRPGVGQNVARLLVPSGFRLVSSLNAPKFNVETTRIVAASEEFLDEAYLAQRLLGVGEVYIVDQESLVADLSIVVGKDFLRR
jgi:hypothetical protein